jgi:hypothetical protein
MNTLSKLLVASTIALAGVSAQAAQGELYQFNDGPAVARTTPAVVPSTSQFAEVGQWDKVAAPSVDRATIKAMINDAGGLNSLTRG